MIQVNFVTKTAYVLPTSAPIIVDASNDRVELSKMLNDLLELPEKKMFDFLVTKNGVSKFLRSTLADLQLPSEEVIEIEYTLALLDLEISPQATTKQWISNIRSVSDNSLVLTTMAGSLLFYETEKDLALKWSVTESEWPISGLEISSTSVFTGGRQGLVREYSLATGAFLGETVTSAHVLSLAVSPDEVSLAVSSGEGKLLVVNMGERKVQNEFQLSAQPLPQVLWRSATVVFVACLDEHVHVFDVASGSSLRRCDLSRPVICMAWTRGGLVSGHDDGRVSVWDVEISNQTFIRNTWTSHTRQVTRVAIQGERVISTAQDGTVKVFDPRCEKIALQSVQVEDRLTALTITPLGKVFVGGSKGLLNQISLSD